MSNPLELNLGEDYYMEGDNMVFTQRFLLKRGYCCNSSCRHCPYGDEAELKIDLRIDGLDRLAGNGDGHDDD
jgi:hypothetical protein